MTTILQQGRFTSNEETKQLILRSDVDWIEVYNYTQAGAQNTPGRAVKYFWQRGFANDTGIKYAKSDGADTIEVTTVTAGGFTLFDSSSSRIGALDTTITAISTADPPAVTVNSTASLSTGDVVRFSNQNGASQLGGIDFTITVVDGTTFSLPYMTQLAQAGGNGEFRPIKYDPLFYPPKRFITNITQAQQAVVSMSVRHNYTVGQEVQLVVPDIYGMSEANRTVATIVASTVTNTVNTITLDVDTSNFSAFNFPDDGDSPFTPAYVVPVGQAAERPYGHLLDDATENTGKIGIELAAGPQAPAGSNNDVIYWVAGKAFEVDNN